MQQADALAILKSGHNVFLTGSAGSGKTYLLNQYIDYLRRHQVAVAVTAATGIAATHLNGMTIHSWSGIGIRDHLDQGTLNKLLSYRHLKKNMHTTQVLVIDEVSMLSPNVIDMVDAVLRAFKKNSQPFGGIQVIFSGDFFQLPPVQNRMHPQEEWLNESRFCWSSNSWAAADLAHCYLTDQYRQDDDQLSQILNDIRTGDIQHKTIELLQSRMNVEFEQDQHPIRLFTHNRNTQHLNQKELATMPGDTQTYKMRSFGNKGLVERFKNSVTKIIPETLELKENAQVIFTKNNYEAGYLNGSLGKVVGFQGKEQLPVVKLLSGKKIMVERQSWSLEEEGEVVAELAQMPLSLAWAITIHKSQGMSLDAAEIDLSKAFELGQGYVALSRLTKLSGLKLLGFNQTALQVDEQVLQQDSLFQKAARQWQAQMQQVSDEQKQRNFDSTLERFGGIKPTKSSMPDQSETATPKSKPKSKANTYDQTYQLLKAGKDLEQIAKLRELKLTTIIHHIEKLNMIGKDLSMAAFKPSQNTLTELTDSIARLKQNPMPDFFNEQGQLRLKPIYEDLGESMSYDDIRLAMSFIEGKPKK